MIQSLLLAFLAFPGFAAPAAPASGPAFAALPGNRADTVVHAVMFYSPTCPHCHKVITEDFPPLMKKYGDHLLIAGVDVTTPLGQKLYQATVDHFKIGQSRLGVPTLVVGSEVLVGDVEIPERFPGLIEKGLAAGGIDWPPVQEIRQVVDRREAAAESPARADSAAAGDTAAAAPAQAPASPDSAAPGDTGAAAETPRAGPDTASRPVGLDMLGEDVTSLGVWARFRLDPLANGIAVLVFLGMLVALASSLRSVARGLPPALTLPGWAVPVLAAVGMAVASYLALVEMTGSMAVCGPVGNCNAVQQSPYAFLLGIPVGALGQAGYLGMFIAWALGTLGPRGWRDSASLALWAMALAGVVFSAYLTFLEPFVIGASCVWCLTSAVVMTLMLMAATPGVVRLRE